MTNTPPATLTKAYTNLTGTKDRGKKFIISVVAAYIILELIGKASDIYSQNGASDYRLNIYIILCLCIGVSVWVLIHDDAIFYKVGNLTEFLYRWVIKKDFVYKHDKKKSSDKQLQQHVKALTMDEENGIIHFTPITIYKNYKCNAAFVLVVNPNDVQDLDLFNEVTALLLYSIQPGILQKYITIQSQDITEIAEQYEERLKLPDNEISPQERAGLFYTKQFLLELSNRVNWAYFIFIGAGYYTNTDDAVLHIDRIRTAYELFLNDTGIESRLITSQYEYSLIVKQMRSLKSVGVVSV